MKFSLALLFVMFSATMVFGQDQKSAAENYFSDVELINQDGEKVRFYSPREDEAQRMPVCRLNFCLKLQQRRDDIRARHVNHKRHIALLTQVSVVQDKCEGLTLITLADDAPNWPLPLPRSRLRSAAMRVPTLSGPDPRSTETCKAAVCWAMASFWRR